MRVSLPGLLLLTVLLPFACSAPAGNDPAADGGSDAGGACAAVGECPATACGFSVDACEQTLDCTCAYTAVPFTPGGKFDVLSSGDEILVVNASSLRSLRAGAFVETPLDAGVVPSGSTFFEAALSPDRKVWVVAGSLSSTVVATDATGEFAVDLALSSPHLWADIAVLADGTVGVLSGAPASVTLRTRAPGGAWQAAPLATTSGAVTVSRVALAAGASGFWAAWVDSQGAITVRSPAGAAASLEQRASTLLTGFGHRLALAIGGDGAPHLVFPGDAGLVHATFDGAWVLSPLPNFHWFPPNFSLGADDLALAVGPDGTLTLAVNSHFSSTAGGVSVAQRVGGRWFAQPVIGDTRCDEDTRIGLAVTSRGPFVATSCQRAAELSVRRAPGFREACVGLIESAALRAQECQADGGTRMACTRYAGSFSSGQFCGGTSPFSAAFCGAATQPLSALTDCAATLTTPTCVDGANALSLACSSFFDAASP